MSNSNRHRREKLFKLFSKNLEWIKEDPTVVFEPDFSDGYICPLCFNAFDIKDINPDAENPLTLEDVPPKALGGKIMTLTCKNCNSKSGHELDNHVLNRLLELDSFSFLPNSNSDVTFQLNRNKVNGRLRFDKYGKMEIHIETERSNPAMADAFNKEMFPRSMQHNSVLYLEKLMNNEIKTPPFKIRFKRKSDERRAKVALLRIAYLIAYSNIGNGFYLNNNLYKIREQISNPDKKIIPDSFIINYEYPENMEGINIITEPKNLRAFLIIFRLETKSKSRQFSVILPGPSGPGIKVYDNLLQEFKKGNESGFISGMIEKINYNGFVKEKKFAFAINYLWQKYTSDDYKPNLP